MKVAILWLINERGEILISQRASHMDSDAGMWGPSVSGQIDEGETGAQAAVREANEELGISAVSLRPIHLHDETQQHNDGEPREFNIFYSNIESEMEKAFVLEPEEVEAVKWVTLDELKAQFNDKPETVLISYAVELWKKIFDNLRDATV